MNVYYITFRSVTYAQRGERVLRERRIRCSLQRTPKWMEEQGCGYSLRLLTGDISGAVEALNRARVPLRRVYVQREDGGLEGMSL